MIYPIVIYGNEVLRKQCEEIAPDYPEVKKLVEDMFLTLGEAEGVGLAAPQIGKDIRLFMEWCAEGPSTYPKRKAMFEERKAHMESEIVNMNRALDMLKFKCWYYEQAIQDGNEDRVKALIPDNLPEEIKDTYDNAHTQ